MIQFISLLNLSREIHLITMMQSTLNSLIYKEHMKQEFEQNGDIKPSKNTYELSF